MTDADKIKLAKDLKELKVTVAVAPGTTTPVIPPAISGIAYDATGAELKRFNNQKELNDFLPTLCTEHATNLPGLSITGTMKYTDWPAFDQVFMFDKKNIIAVKKKANVNTTMAALVGDTKEVLVEIKNDKAHFTVKRVSGGADFPIDKLDEINKYLKALCATRGKTVMELVNVTLKSADWSGFFNKYDLEKDSIKEKTMVDADTAKKEKAVNDTDHVKFEFNNDKVEILLVKKDGSSQKFNDLDTFNEFLEFACNMKSKTAKELDDDGFFKTNDKTKFYGGVYEFDGNKIVEKSKKKKKAKTKNTSNKTSSGKLKKIAKGAGCVLLAGGLLWLGAGLYQVFFEKKLYPGGTNGKKVLEENGMSSEDATVDFGSATYDPEADVIRDAHAQEFDLIDAHDLNNSDAVRAFMDQIKYYTRNPDGHSLAAVADPDDKSTIEVIDALLCEGSTNSIQQIEGYVMDGNTELVLNGEVRKVVAFNNLHPLDKGIPILALSCRLDQCTRPAVIFEKGADGKDDSGKYIDFNNAVNDKIESLGGARIH